MSPNPTLNIPQARFLKLNKKFRSFVAGYGSGKTWCGGSGLMAHFWEFPGINAGYFAPTYPQIRDIFYPTSDEVAFDWGLKTKIHESNKEVGIYQGKIYRGTIICRSMEKPGTIIGFKIGKALVDEIDVLPAIKADQAWTKIIARMRYKIEGLKNGVDVTTTPEGFKFAYKQFVKQIVDDPKLSELYGLVQASTYDNESNLPKDYISSLLATYPSALRAAYLNGQFVNLASGTVYKSYNREAHRSTEKIKEGEPLYIGMDFNIREMAATIYVRREKVWHAVAELSGVYDTPEITRIIKERYQSKGHKIYIYPDASGVSGSSTDASLSDIAILEQAGFSIRAHSANPAVRDRINATNAAFEKGLLFINDYECKTVAECFEQQAYDKNGEPDKEGGHDHQNDASTYPIEFEMPIIKPVAQIKVRWGR